MEPVITAGLIAGGADLLAGGASSYATHRANERNLAMQRDFAQNGIRWKVEDAKRAGVHPLYALGAQTMSPTIAVQPDPVSEHISRMGQNISQSIMKTQTETERMESMMRLYNLSAQSRMWDAQAEMYRAEARKSQGLGPTIPAAGAVKGILRHLQSKNDREVPVLSR